MFIIIIQTLKIQAMHDVPLNNQKDIHIFIAWC